MNGEHSRQFIMDRLDCRWRDAELDHFGGLALSEDQRSVVAIASHHDPLLCPRGVQQLRILRAGQSQLKRAENVVAQALRKLPVTAYTS
jgi:hypothetical protein